MEPILIALAENKSMRTERACIALPASDGQINVFRRALNAGSDSDIEIRYAGTGDYWSIDQVLLENCFDRKGTTIDELNLLAYLLERMDENQLNAFNGVMSEYTNDLGSTGFVNIVNEAYDILSQAEESGEAATVYESENLTGLIEAERNLRDNIPDITQTMR